VSDEIAPETSAEAQPAPVETKAPVAEPTTKAAPPPKPRTPDDDFEDLLKKSGGLKYKAAGKEKSITSAAELRRILSRVDGTEAAAGAALNARREADGIKARVEALAQMKPADRLKALAEIGIPADKLREAFEEQILADDEKRTAQKDLTPRERELQARLEEREAALAEHESARQRWEREQFEEKEAAQAGQLYEKISTVAAKALQSSRIAAEHVNAFLPAIAEEIDRKERLGLEYDEQDIAETVVKRHGNLARDYYAGLDLAAHLDELRAMEMPDPADPTKKTTRLKLMMRAEAARIRGEKSGGASPVVRQVRAAESNGVAMDPIDAARTFGGGVVY
jgi:hypothetical protein